MAVLTQVAEPAAADVPLPQWIESSLEVKEGRDPLGLQTTTQDGLMPRLLPGILELSRRARYFSFHAFLLAEYQDKKMPPEGKTLGSFIRHREWDLGLAIQRCPNKCGSSPVGARRLGSHGLTDGPFKRDESVESPYGGYGLYYRTPMIEFGLVARSGTMLGEKPISIDVLRQGERATNLAREFKAAVQHTDYYRRWMWTTDLLPVGVIDELAEVACLCRLREREAERDAVHEAMFDLDRAQSTVDEAPPGHPGVSNPERAVVQRRRSVAHYLTLIEANPDVVESEAAYRDGFWSANKFYGDDHEFVAGQWAALVAKDAWQEAICSLWSEFCRAGLAQTRALDRGLTWQETHDVAASMVVGPPALSPNQNALALATQLADTGVSLTSVDGQPLNLATKSLEALCEFTRNQDSAVSGLLVLLELNRRCSTRKGGGWRDGLAVRSAWQPSVANVLRDLNTHMATGASVAETLRWLVANYVIPVHERICYSKLPEFAFRFRWEDGLVRFYDLGLGRFPLAGIRHAPLASLTRDLGLWDRRAEGGGQLTDRGRRFIEMYLV